MALDLPKAEIARIVVQQFFLRGGDPREPVIRIVKDGSIIDRMANSLLRSENSRSLFFPTLARLHPPALTYTPEQLIDVVSKRFDAVDEAQIRLGLSLVEPPEFLLRAIPGSIQFASHSLVQKSPGTPREHEQKLWAIHCGLSLQTCRLAFCPCSQTTTPCNTCEMKNSQSFGRALRLIFLSRPQVRVVAEQIETNKEFSRSSLYSELIRQLRRNGYEDSLLRNQSCGWEGPSTCTLLF